MSFSRDFADAAALFNHHRWEEAASAFSELSSASTHPSENTLCAGFSKLARIYNRVLDTEHYDRELISSLKSELDRLVLNLENELPARVMGINIHGLADAIEHFEEDIEFVRTPVPIKIHFFRPGEDDI